MRLVALAERQEQREMASSCYRRNFRWMFLVMIVLAFAFNDFVRVERHEAEHRSLDAGWSARRRRRRILGTSVRVPWRVRPGLGGAATALQRLHP
jgi:hypothetical protein